MGRLVIKETFPSGITAVFIYDGKGNRTDFYLDHHRAKKIVKLILWFLVPEVMTIIKVIQLWRKRT